MCMCVMHMCTNYFFGSAWQYFVHVNYLFTTLYMCIIYEHFFVKKIQISGNKKNEMSLIVQFHVIQI